MGWERGRYYTRSKKVNGRVVREYIGSGRVAQLAAELDAIERDRREGEALERRCIRAEHDEFAAMLADLNERCDLLTRAALFAAGYHQHKRGEWRKRRVHKEATAAGTERGRGSREAGGAADSDRG
jgi:hypothetical protein